MAHIRRALLLLSRRSSFYHGEGAGRVPLDDALVAGLVDGWLSDGSIWRGLHDQGSLLALHSLGGRASSDGRFGPPIIICNNDCILLLLYRGVGLCPTTELLSHHDARLHRINLRGHHIGDFLVNGRCRFIVVCLATLLIIILRCVYDVLRPLRVHLVMVNVHFEDLLDLKVVLGAALGSGGRLVDGRSICSVLVVWCAAVEGESDFMVTILVR